ncbi:unnamed protein product [Vitrella brassicaformis CCMP3155]|uniref:Uncharacterized protein n=1 Tax=Vitrella brassicaformis (strain CCMP3155) TaxID=1169540 RepID=A0A0G4ET53_VITBC|nr:unnamed protein product [Vitrella brassicaformis CCMP3155]|eukprot:CEM00897.1 unnamed protein product [Vitrella brassicaformis CCMP3155]
MPVHLPTPADMGYTAEDMAAIDAANKAFIEAEKRRRQDAAYLAAIKADCEEDLAIMTAMARRMEVDKARLEKAKAAREMERERAHTAPAKGGWCAGKKAPFSTFVGDVREGPDGWYVDPQLFGGRLAKWEKRAGHVWAVRVEEDYCPLSARGLANNLWLAAINIAHAGREAVEGVSALFM